MIRQIFDKLSFFATFACPQLMQIKRLLPILFFLLVSVTRAQPHVNKTEFYKALKSENLLLIDQQIERLKQGQNSGAYSGALLIRKSGLPGNAKDKLNLFKQGHSSLENAIKKDSTNAEFRLLRLIIQENIPKILKYNGETKKDASYLRNSFKNLPEALQKEILDYSKSSKELKPEDFNGKGHE